MSRLVALLAVVPLLALVALTSGCAVEARPDEARAARRSANMKGPCVGTGICDRFGNPNGDPRDRCTDNCLLTATEGDSDDGNLPASRTDDVEPSTRSGGDPASDPETALWPDDEEPTSESEGEDADLGDEGDYGDPA
jgi:hypothetical protein